MATEEFQFWQKTKMQNRPAWISVHEVLKTTLNGLLQNLTQMHEDRSKRIQSNLVQLSKLDSIRNYTYTVDQVSGDDFDMDEVVGIFNRVNSAGTKLTKSDLALAHFCVNWPDIRTELRAFQKDLAARGIHLKFPILVQCLTGTAAGSVLLEGSTLKITADNLKDAWNRSSNALVYLIDLLRHEAFVCKVKEDLPSPKVLVPVTIYLARHQGHFPTDTIKRRFIRWLYLAGMWGRYSGASDTKLQQDVAIVTTDRTDPTHELEAAILRERDRVTLNASDLAGKGYRSSAAAMSHIVARARGARDWFTGKPIYDMVLRCSNVPAWDEMRPNYVFSRAVLKKAGVSGRKVVNEISNRAFLTERVDSSITSSSPENYLPKVEGRLPGALREQLIPMNRDLWHADRYVDFLAERRKQLAQAINDFVESWLSSETAGSLDKQAVQRLMGENESERLEFKSSYRWDLERKCVSEHLRQSVLKALAGFLNARGGILLIGIADSGEAVGIANDYRVLTSKESKQNQDGFELHLRDSIASYLGESASSFMTIRFHEIDGCEICCVCVKASDHPIFLNDGRNKPLFVRVGNQTRAFPVAEAIAYVQKRFGSSS